MRHVHGVAIDLIYLPIRKSIFDATSSAVRHTRAYTNVQNAICIGNRTSHSRLRISFLLRRSSTAWLKSITGVVVKPQKSLKGSTGEKRHHPRQETHNCLSLFESFTLINRLSWNVLWCRYLSLRACACLLSSYICICSLLASEAPLLECNL